MVYKRTGVKADVLAYQCAIRLLRGESLTTVHSSLLARGVSDVDKIMEHAEAMALSERNEHDSGGGRKRRPK